MRHQTPALSSSNRQTSTVQSKQQQQPQLQVDSLSSTTTNATTPAGGQKKTPPKSPPGSTPTNRRQSITSTNPTTSGVFAGTTQSSLSLSVTDGTVANNYLNVSSQEQLSNPDNNNSSLNPSLNNTTTSRTTTQHHPHSNSVARNKQAHFVLDTVRLKKTAVFSADLSDAKLLAHDNVSNVCSINKEMVTQLVVLPLAALVASGNLTPSVSFDATTAPTTSLAASRTASKIVKDKEAKAVQNLTTTFSEVSYASDSLGASVEVQNEVEHFFETGIPLVSSDQVPDADALIVISAGPDAQTSARLTLTAVEGAARYMSHRSLCVHVSGCVIFGNVEEMLGRTKKKEFLETHHNNQQQQSKEDDSLMNTTGTNSNDPTLQQQQQSIPLEQVAIADVNMTDLFEHSNGGGGGMRNFRPFVVSEPREPFWDRYTPKHLQRLGMSNEDLEDKLTQIKILTQDQLVKQFPKAVGFLFFLDCIHFRDGFQRFTSDSHVTVSSQHAANSLFHSRTTVLATHTPALASALVGHVPAENSDHHAALMLQPWLSACRHLAAETHHVLNIVASVPEIETPLGSSVHVEAAEQVLDVDQLQFDTSTPFVASNQHEEEDNKPEVIAARRTVLTQLKNAFDVTAALQKATQAGARHQIPDHVFPKRTHLKLNEYVPHLKRVHDEMTNDQKTRHSFAKSALQYLAMQVKGDDAVTAHMSGLGDNNREKFAAIFRAAFVKSKVQKEQLQQFQKRSESNYSSGGGGKNNNNTIDSRSQSNNNIHQNLMNMPVNNNNNNNNNFTLSNLNVTAFLNGTAALSSSSPASGGGGETSSQFRQQAEALLLVKERLEFDLAKSDKEVKKLRSELSASQTKRKRLERELTDSQGQSLVAEAYVQKLQTEQSTECVELRQRLLNMQQQIDALGRKNQELNNTIRVNKEEFERKEKVLKEDNELLFRDLRTDLEIAIAEKSVLQESLEEHTGRIHAVEEVLVQIEVEKKNLNQQLADSRNAIESAKSEARKAIERASRMRKAEREEYLRLLESGRSSTEELVTFDDLRVDRVAAAESLYRTGADGVKNWLKAISLDQHSSLLINAGFSDILSVANITEQDLISMKVLSGHRRKMMAAVSELKSHLAVAISKRQVAPIQHDAANFEVLIARQKEWYRDFAAVVRAEQANDDEEVFL